MIKLFPDLFEIEYSIVQKGYAKDDPTLPQVNTDYVIRQSDGMPITYLHSPGSVTDIASASEMIKFFEEIGKELGKKIHIVLSHLLIKLSLLFFISNQRSMLGI